MERQSLTEDATAFNTSLVLIVSPSHVDRLVLSGMIAGFGMKAVALSPHEAREVLDTERPFIVIADAPEHEGITHLMGDISERRQASEEDLPLVVQLRGADCAAEHDVVDLVVEKPVRSETLQAQISRLIARRR